MYIGIIGAAGNMGQMYAKAFADLGHQVQVADLPEKKEALEQHLSHKNIRIFGDPATISKTCDFIIYAVPAEKIDRIVEQYGPDTKKSAIVAGATSVKHPEILAFEDYLPQSVNINTFHSLHGPKTDPRGQTMVTIRHRSSAEAYQRMQDILRGIGSEMVELPSFFEHDKITAHTQAVTHVAYQSMGKAWRDTGVFPWEDPSYVGGIDNVKILMTLRLFGGNAHVYSGLAMLNPFARRQIEGYRKATQELLGLMEAGDETRLMKRVGNAGMIVLSGNKPIMLDDAVMAEHSLGKKPENPMPNSHLSLLAMVVAWHDMRVNPYEQMICQTPPFKLRLGITEYLFRHPELWMESVNAAVHYTDIRDQDRAFVDAVDDWGSIIASKDVTDYNASFLDVQTFFGKEKMSQAGKISEELIRRLTVQKAA